MPRHRYGSRTRPPGITLQVVNSEGRAIDRHGPEVHRRVLMVYDEHLQCYDDELSVCAGMYR